MAVRPFYWVGFQHKLQSLPIRGRVVVQEIRSEKKTVKPYGLAMDRREHLSLTGVKDVVSFDESQVILNTEGGLMTISGQGLHVARLMLEEGQLVLDGTVDSLVYEGKRLSHKGGLAARIFR